MLLDEHPQGFLRLQILLRHFHQDFGLVSELIFHGFISLPAFACQMVFMLSGDSPMSAHPDRAAGLAPAAAGCRRPCGGLGGPQVFSRLRSLLCVQLTPPVFLPGRWPCRFSRFNPWRLAFNRAAWDGCIIARLNASVKRFSQTFFGLCNLHG